MAAVSVPSLGRLRRTSEAGIPIVSSEIRRLRPKGAAACRFLLRQVLGRALRGKISRLNRLGRTCVRVPAMFALNED